jgi:hypothetical protein
MIEMEVQEETSPFDGMPDPLVLEILSRAASCSISCINGNRLSHSVDAKSFGMLRLVCKRFDSLFFDVRHLSWEFQGPQTVNGYGLMSFLQRKDGALESLELSFPWSLRQVDPTSLGFLAGMLTPGFTRTLTHLSLKRIYLGYGPEGSNCVRTEQLFEILSKCPQLSNFDLFVNQGSLDFEYPSRKLERMRLGRLTSFKLLSTDCFSLSDEGLACLITMCPRLQDLAIHVRCEPRTTSIHLVRPSIVSASLTSLDLDVQVEKGFILTPHGCCSFACLRLLYLA